MPCRDRVAPASRCVTLPHLASCGGLQGRFLRTEPNHRDRGASTTGHCHTPQCVVFYQCQCLPLVLTELAHTSLHRPRELLPLHTALHQGWQVRTLGWSKHCVGVSGEDTPQCGDSLSHRPALQTQAAVSHCRPWQLARGPPAATVAALGNLQCAYSSEQRQTSGLCLGPSGIRQAEPVFFPLKYLPMHPHSRD